MKRFKTLMTLTFCGAALAMLSACNTVVFTTASTVGIEVNALESASQTVKVGYHRFEGVVMPHDPEDGATNKTYSVRSIFEMRVGPFLVPAFGDQKRGVAIEQVFATGSAASGSKLVPKVELDSYEVKAIEKAETEKVKKEGRRLAEAAGKKWKWQLRAAEKTAVKKDEKIIEAAVDAEVERRNESALRDAETKAIKDVAKDVAELSEDGDRADLADRVKVVNGSGLNRSERNALATRVVDNDLEGLSVDEAETIATAAAKIAGDKANDMKETAEVDRADAVVAVKLADEDVEAAEIKAVVSERKAAEAASKAKIKEARELSLDWLKALKEVTGETDGSDEQKEAQKKADELEKKLRTTAAEAVGGALKARFAELKIKEFAENEVFSRIIEKITGIFTLKWVRDRL